MNDDFDQIVTLVDRKVTPIRAAIIKRILEAEGNPSNPHAEYSDLVVARNLIQAELNKLIEL